MLSANAGLIVFENVTCDLWINSEITAIVDGWTDNN